MSITLPNLLYDKDALEPYISAKTLDFHHGKHHNAYVTNLNNLITGTDLEKSSLEDIIMKSFNNPSMAGIFNNAAQAWNHAFYWNCMKKNGGGKPTGKLAEEMDKNFISFDKFLEEIKNAAITQFGSGWAWLVKDHDSLKIIKTSNADTPMIHGSNPLLVIDVWEHAYYLDYQNQRPNYVAAFFENLVNWDFVASQI